MLKLDHVIVSVYDLDQATADFRDLGFNVVYGGRHGDNITHNALICFRDGSYIEIIALTGEGGTPGTDSLGSVITRGEGIIGFALRADDLSEQADRINTSGFTVLNQIPGERVRQDGQHVMWTMMNTREFGFAPFFIEDVTPHNLRVPDDDETTRHDNTAFGVAGITLVSPDPAADAARFERLLGIPVGANHTFTLGDDAFIALKHYPNAEALTFESMTLRCIDKLPSERLESHNAIIYPQYPGFVG